MAARIATGSLIVSLSPAPSLPARLRHCPAKGEPFAHHTPHEWTRTPRCSTHFIRGPLQWCSWNERGHITRDNEDTSYVCRNERNILIFDLCNSDNEPTKKSRIINTFILGSWVSPPSSTQDLHMAMQQQQRVDPSASLCNGRNSKPRQQKQNVQTCQDLQQGSQHEPTTDTWTTLQIH